MASRTFFSWNRRLPSGDDGLPIHILHHQIIWPDVVNLADVGVVQCSDGFGFALETLGELRSRYFDRDHAIQARIRCGIDLAHAPAADLCIHAIGA